MAAVDVGARPEAVGTGQYDEAVEEFWRDLGEPAQQATADIWDNRLDSAAKGIDEEIKITKKRRPIAKLDADRLLSENGIPELRRRARKRVKFSGKGHEFDDMNTILTMYMMWMDDLFPKAKFRDGLAIIEKVGHSKRLNVMRKAWMTATRPVPLDEPDDIDHDDPSHDTDHDSIFGDKADATSENDATGAPTGITHAAPDEDELDMLLAQEDAARPTETSNTNPRRPFNDDDDDDQDDLDALLDHETSSSVAAGNQQAIKPRPIPAQDDFADEEAAMLEMGL